MHQRYPNVWKINPEFQLPVADGKNAEEDDDLVELDMLAGGEFLPWSDDDGDCEDNYDQQ